MRFGGVGWGRGGVGERGFCSVREKKYHYSRITRLPVIILTRNRILRKRIQPVSEFLGRPHNGPSAIASMQIPKGPFRTKNTTAIAKIVNYYAVVFLLRPPNLLRRGPFLERENVCNSQENGVCTRCAAIVNHSAIENLLLVVNLVRVVFLVRRGPLGLAGDEAHPKAQPPERWFVKVGLRHRACISVAMPADSRHEQIFDFVREFAVKYFRIVPVRDSTQQNKA